MGIIATNGGTPQLLAGAISLDDNVIVLNGNTDDLNPSGGAQLSLFVLQATANLNLTGIAGGIRNRQLFLVNVGPGTITLKNNTGSQVGNCFIFGADVTLAPNDGIGLLWSPFANGWLNLSGTSGGGGGSVTPGGNNVFTGSNEFDGAFLLNGVLTPAALAAGTTNDYAPANLLKSNALRLSGDAGGSSLSGMLAAGNGQQFLVINVGAGLLTFLNQNAGSAAANQFICPGGGDFSLVADGTCSLWYDGVSARYRVMV